eukprot:CAMPEP_0184479046 /NCGR_PEP_ID=MMETSP0113_2-20130426/911_1 /TAXON_ID=91329 /ORGANISM="Norrisiella sphaerica, Strain BC52" /LENGTH=868 /DNA_ID=CAMNT_0026857035 /DNA_START=82 /DNA_END=2688 /DNA_ORIENTATION=-
MSYGISSLFIRPPRANYSGRALGPRVQRLTLWDGEPIHVQRVDFHIRNRRNYALECTLYIPSAATRKRGQSKKGSGVSFSKRRNSKQNNNGERRDVILYCHGASGGRLDGLTDAWEIAMQHRMALCTFDFSGCGLSQGNTVTLGFFEEDDIRMVVKNLAAVYKYTHIVLWGRSMGAVACLRLMSHGTKIPPPPFCSAPDYNTWNSEELLELVEDLGGNSEEFYDHEREALNENITLTEEERTKLVEAIELLSSRKRFKEARSAEKKERENEEKRKAGKEVEDTSYMQAVAGLVLDSPYANLWNVATHIVEHYKSMLPQFVLRSVANAGLPMIRKAVLSKISEFDIKKMECLTRAQKCRIPCIILHGRQDSLIPWKHSERLFQAYANPELPLYSDEKKKNSSSPKEKEFSTSPASKKKEVASKKVSADKSFMRVSCGRLTINPRLKSRQRSQNSQPKTGTDVTVAAKSPSTSVSSQKDDAKSAQESEESCLLDSPGLLKSPNIKATESQAFSPLKVFRQLVLVEGDHNSLRPIKYYDSISKFFYNQVFKEHPPPRCGLPKYPLCVVPGELYESKLKFFYGVAMISEFTEQKLKIHGIGPKLPPPSPPAAVQRARREENLKRRAEDGDKQREKEREKESVMKAAASANEFANLSIPGNHGYGVSCSIRTVSVSWRVVIALHPQKGLLILRPYSGGTLYSVRYTELLSCVVLDPMQLEFVFLDSYQTQRRVRFYNTKVFTIKDYIDRSMRRLTQTSDMTNEEVAETINANLSHACATLVDKHLVHNRGLTTRRVRAIADSLLDTIESMMKDRNEKGGVSAKTRRLVESALVKAVEERTGWRPVIERSDQEAEEESNGRGHRRESSGQCTVS